jgi:hypothetical protein
MKLDPNSAAHIELLAKDLHEAGREAVAAGQTMRGRAATFIEWAKIAEHVREGRRVQARWLLTRYRLLRD